MEDSFAQTYSGFFTVYLTSASPIGTAPPVFQSVTSDTVLQSLLPSIIALVPRVQGASPPLTASENATWVSIVNQFKTHPYQLAGTGRLKNEAINIYLMPTSDIYKGGAFNSSTSSIDHNYVEYMVEITWTDSRGKPRHESITTRRSQ
jgi:hypothetical protein